MVQKPIIGVLVDNSLSVSLQPDGKKYTTEVPNKVAFIQQELSKKYDVRAFTFDQELNDSLRYTFKGTASNPAWSLDQFADRFEGQNIGAIILASDGIFNQGKNPWYFAQSAPYPIYGLALGDTTPQKDIAIQKIKANEVALKGNDFEVGIDLFAQEYSGNRAAVSLYQINADGRETTLKTGMLAITNDRFTGHLSFMVSASEGGLQHYRVRTSVLPGEKNTQNNQRDFFVEVIHDQAKILILSAGPHPDITAIRQILSKKQSIELVVKNTNENNINIPSYDAVIAYQLPSFEGNNQILSSLKSAQIPVWWMGGIQTSLNQWNSYQQLIKVRAGGRMFNDITPLPVTGFSYFGISEKTRQRIASFPPLDVPYGDYFLAGNGSALLNQQIKSIPTTMPLWAFGENNGVREAVLAGEGLWRWNLDEFEQYGDHAALDELISKTIQYLSLKQNKKNFRAKPDRLIYDEGEEVLFSAELFNKNFEPTNEPEVSLMIKDSKGKSLNYTLGKSDQRYLLNVGKFSEGKYQFEAKTQYQGTNYVEKGSFSVQGTSLEAAITQADWNNLRKISSPGKAEVLPYQKWENIVSMLQRREDLKPVSYWELLLTEALDLPWIFVALLALWSAEWLWRKWLGHA